MLTDLSMFVTFTFIISQKKNIGKENTNFFNFLLISEVKTEKKILMKKKWKTC